MPPIEKETIIENVSSSSDNSNNETVIIRPKNQAPYVRCVSKNSFKNPFDNGKTPAEINDTELNLYLGYEFLNVRKCQFILQFFKFLDNLLLVWWEKWLYKLIRLYIPVNIRRKIYYTAWYIFVPIHKYFFTNKTGIHKSQSLEYHAFTTAQYFVRFLPLTIPRIRYFLDEVTTSHPTDIQTSILETIQEDLTDDLPHIPDVQKDACTVSGIYLHHRPNKNVPNPPPTEYTLIFFPGGAFIGGTPIGYVGPADMFGTNCGMDVFIPDIRLCPDIEFHDVLWDVSLVYRWVYNLRVKRGQDPNKIMFIGLSSGAGLASRLYQFFNEIEHNVETLPTYITPILKGLGKPKGCVIMSGYVNYNDDNKPDGSFFQYSKHDLIVTPPLVDATIPYLDTNMNGERNLHSPKVHSFQGAAPMCVVLSEHEACYEENCDLINKARSDGVHVTVGMWRYMCHAWCFMHGFIPEGAEGMRFACDWINEQKSKD